MPTLRPLTDVARYDARFVADVVVPALRAAGVSAEVSVRAGDDNDDDAGNIVIDANDAALDALLAGKQKTELSALDKMRADKRGASAKDRAGDGAVTVRARASVLRALVRALRPAVTTSKGARDLGVERSSAPKKKARDRVRRADGGYIKGRRAGARTPSTGAHVSPTVTTTATTSVNTTMTTGAPRGPTDREAFAVQNLVAFVEAGLLRAGDVDDACVLVIAPGEVRRV